MFLQNHDNGTNKHQDLIFASEHAQERKLFMVIFIVILIWQKLTNITQVRMVIYEPNVESQCRIFALGIFM